MQEIIAIEIQTIAEDALPTVNARDLHAFLGVGKVFRAWIQERIVLFGFIENQDFVVSSEIGRNPKGGRPSKEYRLTLDMAKELSMVERTAKGREARKYFIACEKKLYAAEWITPRKKAMTMAVIHSTFKHLVRMQQEFKLAKDLPRALCNAAEVMEVEYGVEMVRYIPGLAAYQGTGVQSQRSEHDHRAAMISGPDAICEITPEIVLDADQLPRLNLSTEEKTLVIGRTYCLLRDQRASAVAAKRKDICGSCLVSVAKKWNVTTATVKRAARFATAIDRLKAIGKHGEKAAEIIMSGKVVDGVTVLPQILKIQPDPFKDVADGICAGQRKIRDVLGV